MASDILRKLEAYPHEEFLSGSPGEALRWMRDLGVAEMLPETAATKPFIGVSDQCKTHWIVVRVVRGEPTPADDGIYVSCLPRTAISGEELKAKIFFTYGGTVLHERAAR